MSITPYIIKVRQSREPSSDATLRSGNNKNKNECK
jgi:hypothetical protein